MNLTTKEIEILKTNSLIMKKTIFLISITMLMSCGSKKILISSEEAAQIFVDGREVASESAIINIPKRTSVNVQIKKAGYVTAYRDYQNLKTIKLPKSDFIRLEVDDAFENSISTDLANQEIDIPTNPNKTEKELWLSLNRVVLDYFDVLETIDENTGYIRTSWVLNKFKSSNIRTRLIVKFGGNNPLTYKVKLISEYAPPTVSIKADEQFQEWDRILRAYEPLIQDLRSRLTR